MKIFILAFLVTFSSFGKSLCNFYCVFNLSIFGESYAQILPTIYTSENNNIDEVISSEIGPHCSKVFHGSKPKGLIDIKPNGQIDIEELNESMSVQSANCTNI